MSYTYNLSRVESTCAAMARKGYHLSAGDCTNRDPETDFPCGECDSCAVESEHSTSPCDLCGDRLHGSRHSLVWFKPGKRSRPIWIAACQDCLILTANGELPADAEIV